jgi:hypothetical protein
VSSSSKRCNFIDSSSEGLFSRSLSASVSRMSCESRRPEPLLNGFPA